MKIKSNYLRILFKDSFSSQIFFSQSDIFFTFLNMFDVLLIFLRMRYKYLSKSKKLVTILNFLFLTLSCNCIFLIYPLFLSVISATLSFRIDNNFSDG